MEKLRHGQSDRAASRLAGISYLRILATIGVVCFHTFSMIAGKARAYSLTDAQLRFFNAGHLIWSWTVPAFFMITGALLLKPGRQTGYRVCILKYCKRVFLALVIFGIPFAGLIQYYRGVRGAALLVNSVAAVLTGKSFEHLWYLYTLMGLYLLVPILSAFAQSAKTRELECALVAMFVFLIIFPTIRRMTGLRIAFIIPIGYSVFYLLMGYYLMYRVEWKAGWTALCGIGAITALLVAFAYTDFMPSVWTYYDNALIAVEAILIFLLFKGIDRRCGERLWSIDRLCFAVYLIHPVFIHFSYRFLKITPCSAGDAYAIAAIGFCMLFAGCSFACSWILNRIKPLREHVL